jgi:phosphohistidine phosphatase
LRSLYLLRHAKSSWDDPNLTDFDRPLSPRGHSAAEAMSKHFRETGIDPQRILCSPSRRTRQTLEHLTPALATRGNRRENRNGVVFEPAIYEAAPRDLLALIRSTPRQASSLLLIGHNPGLASLAHSLLAPDQHDPSLEHLLRKYPTGALATIQLPEGDWEDLRPGSGHLRSFVRPRDLSAP